MMVKSVLAAVFLTFVSDTVFGYVTLQSIEVCNFESQGEGQISDFEAVFENMHNGKFKNPNNIWLEHRGAASQFLFFGIPASGTPDYQVKYMIPETDGVSYFQYLYDNKDECDCALDVFNTPFASASDLQPRGWQTNSNSGQMVEFKACGTWDEHSDDIDDANKQTESDYALTDPNGWACRDVECDLLTDFVSIQYQDFEVFTDPNCEKVTFNSESDAFDCETCASGYHKFAWTTDDTNEESRRKCRQCQEAFGDACMHCEGENGCQQCDIDKYDVIPIRGTTEPCNFQYCGLDCCEDPTPTPTMVEDTPSPTDAPTCYDYDFDGSGMSDMGGSGTGASNCLTDDERSEASDNYKDGLIGSITEPVDAETCSNQGMNCNDGGNDANCFDCDPIDTQSGCAECDDDYFIYSKSHPCSYCGDLNHCVRCIDYMGCIECDAGYHLEWDDDVDILWCQEDDGEPIVPPPFDPTWQLTCIEQCAETDTRGENGYCGCGCDCNDEGQCPDNEELDEDENIWHCDVCHYHAGCDLCENDNTNAELDYFQLSKFHPCDNCNARFGGRCNFCNDFGCAQCIDGYKQEFDECCGLVYCVIDN